MSIYRSLVSGDRLYAWIDQAVVSLANFTALILIARWSGVAEVGFYAAAYSVLALLLAAQESLIIRPYSVHLYEAQDTPTEYSFASLALSFFFSMMATAALVAVAISMLAVGANENLTNVVGALAVAVPFILLREFARRVSFAHLKVHAALWLDIAVAVCNIIFLAGLAAAGRLNAIAAIGSLAVSCSIGAIGWLYCMRGEFSRSWRRFAETLKRSAKLGKWVLLGHMASQAQSYSALWLIASVAGAAATGIYAACASVVAFSNPLVFGFTNILTPRFVRVLHAEGLSSLKRQAARDTLLLAMLMLLFSGCIALVGGMALRLLYPGAEYQGYGHVLNILALVATASAVGAPAYTALISTQRAHRAAGITACSALLNVAAVWWGLTHWGLSGAVYALLASEFVASAGLWGAFLSLRSDRESFDLRLSPATGDA